MNAKARHIGVYNATRVVRTDVDRAALAFDFEPFEKSLIEAHIRSQSDSDSDPPLRRV